MMVKQVSLKLFVAIILFYNCGEKKLDKPSVPNEEIVIDSVSLLYNEMAVELWAPIYPEKIPQAIALYDTAIMIDERNIGAHANRLNLLLKIDSLKARKAFNQIENLYPEVKFSSFFLGMMNEYYGESNKSKFYFDRALSFTKGEMSKSSERSKEMVILNDLGLIYLMLDKPEKADSVYQIIDDQFYDEIDYSFYSGEFRVETKNELIKDFYKSASNGEL